MDNLFATRLIAVAFCVTITSAVSGATPTDSGAPGSPRQQLEFIAAANNSALERLQTIAGEYTRRRFIVDGNQSTELVDRTLHLWWWKDGNRHRVKYYIESSHANRQPAKSDFVDSLPKDNVRSILTGYDWEAMPSLTLAPHHDLYAEVNHAHKDTFFQVDPMVDLCLHVQDTPSPRTLQGLLQAVDYKATVEKVFVGAKGHEHTGYKINLRTPEANRDVAVIVDPAANYLIQECVLAPTEESVKRGGAAYTWMVGQFQKVSHDTYFPDQVVVSTVAEKGTNRIYEVRLDFSSLHVNQPVPDALFHFRFPKNIAVNDKITGAVEIWGDDAPVRTIRTMEEDEDFTAELAGVPKPTRIGFYGFKTTLLLINGAVVIILAGLFAFRFWRRRIPFQRA